MARDRVKRTSDIAEILRQEKRARLVAAIASESSSAVAQSALDTSISRALALVSPQQRPLLHNHQKEAVEFLLRRMIPHLTDDLQHGHMPSSSSSQSSLVQTGAILADDMGTGKTLVALVTASTICRVLTCKAVIVTPSTLTGNWEKEMKKWFASTFSLNAIVITAGSSSSTSSSSTAMDLAVNKFITSHPSVHPLLVLSYDMFRVYAEALNTMTNLELIICDEGHRLKNAFGTKTTLALSNCVAMRRIVLTGTPIQNNLEELYAVIQFIIPDYLGELSEFKKTVIAKIEKGREKNCSISERQEVSGHYCYGFLF